MEHKFVKDDAVKTAGEFLDDDGRRIGSWTWDGKNLEVKAARATRRHSLADFELSTASDDELRQRLVNLAADTVRELRKGVIK